MTSAILSESYSFIWQPKVLMKTFFMARSPSEQQPAVRPDQVQQLVEALDAFGIAVARATQLLELFLVQQPHLVHEAGAVTLVDGVDAFSGQRAGEHQQVVA